MTQIMRRSFRALRVSRPETSFLTYPAPPLLFKTMEPVQKDATLEMAGKGLLSIEHFQRGVGRLTRQGHQTFQASVAALLTDEETKLIAFLTHDFLTAARFGLPELRRGTALRRSLW